MRMTIIVAMTEEGVIGRGNSLPWKSKRDMAHFVRNTKGKFLLMGRKTWESIPKPLKDRETLILSQDWQFEPDWGRKVSSIEEVERIVGDNEVMVAGGAKVYELALPRATRMLVTYVAEMDSRRPDLFHVSPQGDVFFPKFDLQKDWVREPGTSFLWPVEDDPYALRFVSYTKATNVFLVGDWHLGETRMEIMQRPFANPAEMATEMSRCHNAMVSPHDLVFNVGDVLNKNADPEHWLPYVDSFNGRKVLFRGNHDRGISDAKFSRHFETIFQEGDGFMTNLAGVDSWITHYPTRGKKEWFNIVGHIHAAWKLQVNMLNVGVDVSHFRPTNALKIPFYMNAITSFYDDDVWVAYDDVNAGLKTQRVKTGRYFNPPDGTKNGTDVSTRPV
jgi:dihydrofolate reductase